MRPGELQVQPTGDGLTKLQSCRDTLPPGKDVLLRDLRGARHTGEAPKEEKAEAAEYSPAAESVSAKAGCCRKA